MEGEGWERRRRRGEREEERRWHFVERVGDDDGGWWWRAIGFLSLGRGGLSCGEVWAVGLVGNIRPSRYRLSAYATMGLAVRGAIMFFFVVSSRMVDAI